MKILFIASECAPVAKVGGLADVIGSLPEALQKNGLDVSILIPFYDTVKIGNDFELIKPELFVDFAGKKESFELWKTSNNGVPLYLIKNDRFFKGNIYPEKDASSGGSEKEMARFLFLSVAGLEAAKNLGIDILHCHDWQASVIPYLNKTKNLGFKTILTIHNLAYQGICPPKIVNHLIGTDITSDFNSLQLGIENADLLTTVSPNYAKEIMTEEFGCGLEKILQKRKDDLTGILNGIDLKEFDPEKDELIEKYYSAKNIADKITNKTFLQKNYFEDQQPSIPLLSMVSRLAEQKGFDLIKEIFNELLQKNIQFILLGQGIKEYEDFFSQKAKEFPQKFQINIGFDNKLAHQIYAGADIFLMPSRFEPCGLGQMIAMRYGTIPVARSVGGLKDTIAEGKTGFLFEKYYSREFMKTLEKALVAFENKESWGQLQINAMNQDFSWEKSAGIYKTIYAKVHHDRS